MADTNSRLRPWVSDSLPNTGTEIVEVIRNALVTHACPVSPPRLSPIRYIAAATTVWSSEATKVASSNPDRIAITWRRP